MTAAFVSACSRRQAVAAAAFGGLATLGLGLTGVPAAAQNAGVGGAGVAGGGVARTEDGAEAQFALFASRLTLAGDSEPTFFAQLRWKDGEGMTLESTEITFYGPIEDDEKNARRLTGLMTGAGEGEQPFALRVLVDEGDPGSGEDEIELRVGASAATPTAGQADLSYAFTGKVAEGDLQLLDFGPVPEG